MKRLFALFVVVAITVILFFEIKSYRKFSYPNSYDYVIKTKEIDINYYDSKLLLEYYNLATKVGTFAREQWSNFGIDVLSPAESTQAQNAAQNYQMMLARIKFIEGKLLQSQKLKSQSFDNEAIEYIEKNGISEKNYKIHKLLQKRVFKKGDEDMAVWEIQKLINAKGKTIRIDGIFNEETEQAIKDIQKEKNVYPSGLLDTDFLKLIL
ncbi:MAG: peptidoglycan-binding protein [Thermonemataceae bacterium]|nr:peptidoglycan-binding protein [Thermonemataceae bacterium]